MTEKLDIILDAFFGKLQEYSNITKQVPSTIIMPAIGTGFGNLEKYAFYKIAISKLYTFLSDDKNLEYLPKQVIFQIWRNEKDLENTKEALATVLTSLVDKWNENFEKNNENTIRTIGYLIGICLGLLIYFLCVRFSLFNNKKHPSKLWANMSRKDMVFLLLGWLYASFANSCILYLVYIFVFKSDPDWQGYILIGFSSTYLCLIFLRATNIFEKKSSLYI